MGALKSGLAVIVALGGITLAAPALSQEYPGRTIKFIVPITAGSGTDVLARAVAERLSVSLGQTVVIENRPGAGGALGAAFVAKAAPDGYTVLVTSSALAVAPAIYANLPYDPIADFAGVTPIANIGAAFVTAPSKSFKTVRELVAQAKARPGQITYASNGVGSASHLTSEKFRTSAGFEGVHVPYRGANEAMADIMTGRIDFMSAPLTAARALIQDNKLIALAVPSTARSALLPEVPTIVEAGVPFASYDSWVGVLVPKGTPREVVNRLHQDIVKALAMPELLAQFAAAGSAVRSATPEAFDTLIKEEVAANKQLAIAAGIKAN